jgi:hypothetical protein
LGRPATWIGGIVFEGFLEHALTQAQNTGKLAMDIFSWSKAGLQDQLGIFASAFLFTIFFSSLFFDERSTHLLSIVWFHFCYPRNSQLSPRFAASVMYAWEIPRAVDLRLDYTSVYLLSIIFAFCFSSLMYMAPKSWANKAASG